MTGVTAWGTGAGEFFDDPGVLRRFTELDLRTAEYLWLFGSLQIDAWAEGSVGIRATR